MEKNTKNISYHNPGFSLIELVVYIAIFSLLLIIISDMFISSLKTQNESSSRSNVVADGKFILTRFMYDIQNAAGVELPANLGDISDTLNLNINSQNYIYTQNGGNIILTNSNGSDVLNSMDTVISNLQFQKIGNLGSTKPTIKINFTVSGITGLNPVTETQNFEITVGLR